MSSTVRVLLITKSTGGVAEYIRWLVDGIDSNRFSITVVCLSENSLNFAAELRERKGVQTFAYEMNRYQIDLISDMSVGLKLAKLIRSQNFDVIHAHASKPGFLARLAALGTGIPVLYSPHCFAFHDGAGLVTKHVTAFIERLAAYITTYIVAVAEGEHELARKYHVGKDGQFKVIYTGIDSQPYRQPVDGDALKKSLGIPLSSPIIGSVGRLSAQKSPLDFVRMAEAIHRSRPEAHFVWVGNGPLEEEARELANSLRLEHAMHWLGQRQDVPQLLHIFDCFVLTSRWEGFPLVVLEAMSAGAPVIATDIFGTRELIQHGQNGYLVPVGDSASLARFTLDLLADPQKIDRIRTLGQLRIDNEFTRNRMITMIQSLYLQVIGREVMV